MTQDQNRERMQSALRDKGFHAQEPQPFAPVGPGMRPQMSAPMPRSLPPANPNARMPFASFPQQRLAGALDDGAEFAGNAFRSVRDGIGRGFEAVGDYANNSMAIMNRRGELEGQMRGQLGRELDARQALNDFSENRSMDRIETMADGDWGRFADENPNSPFAPMAAARAPGYAPEFPEIRQGMNRPAMDDPYHPDVLAGMSDDEFAQLYARAR